MKIYTKKGDKGYTSLLGGVKVSKDHIRIEAYGTVDELNSYTGLVRDGISDEKVRSVLLDIQKILFSIGAQLASPKSEKESLMKLPEVGDKEVNTLEKSIDNMEQSLKPLQSFILPGGHISVSYCHIARSVCRRAERISVALNQVEEVNISLITYLNRLSDYFFVLARKTAQDQGVEEIKWLPGE